MLNQDIRNLLDYQEERIGPLLNMANLPLAQLALLAMLAHLLILVVRLLLDLRNWEG